MSDLVSGIAKIFSSVGTGVAATLGNAVRGVGAALFTGAAATATPASGGLLAGLFGEGSLLKNIFSGVSTVMGAGPAGAMTAAAAAPAVAATDVAAGGGGFFSNLASGLTSATTATGAAPVVASATAPPVGLAGGFGKAIGTALGNPYVLAGIGGGIGEYQKMKSQEEMAQAQIDFADEQAEEVTASYDVPMSSLAGGEGYIDDSTTAAPQRQSTQQPIKKRAGKSPTWAYNASTGQIEKAA